ncbi:reduced folate carrier-domain-containing protein, partial [Ochromonadaceae sp. CCMP2298]
MRFLEHPEQRVIFSLCLFLALLSFKPSEPYLSEYLICDKATQAAECSSSSASSCATPCTLDSGVCSLQACASLSPADCSSSDYDYCTYDGSCSPISCYKNFTEDQVNNQIYPWSTYAYLPFLLLLGLLAEYGSYRLAILIGITGRVVTRFLLLYGTTVGEMKLMQVVYALGTAAEDVLSAYVYYVLSPAYYQLGTSCIRATNLTANLLAGVCGDLLVVYGDTSLRTLMWVSAGSVCLGFLIGL